MKRIVISTLIGLSALTAGCTGTPGNANPTPTTGSSTPTSNSDDASELKSLRPCDLLTESEAFSFGLKLPGEASMIVGFNTCDWIIPGNGGLNAGINIDTGVKDLNINGDKESDVKVGKFTGVKVEGQDGSKDNCSILIAVSETSSVAVTANMRAGSGDRAGACERATKAADLIAQKLP